MHNDEDGDGDDDVAHDDDEELLSLYVLIMSCTRFRVNPHSIVA